jgi:hypothetical protein
MLNYSLLCSCSKKFELILKLRDNLSISERKSILSLLNDKNIIIKKADKNGNCVILDKVDYLSEVHRQLRAHTIRNKSKILILKI